MLENHSFPPIVALDGLSILLNKATSSILADRCRAPHRLPRACTPPGSKQPLWITADVIEWLAQFKEAPCVAVEPAPARRGPGRPRKADEIAARNGKVEG